MDGASAYSTGDDGKTTARYVTQVGLLSKFWPEQPIRQFNRCHGLPFGMPACYNYHYHDESLGLEGEMSGGRPGFSYEDVRSRSCLPNQPLSQPNITRHHS